MAIAIRRAKSFYVTKTTAAIADQFDASYPVRIEEASYFELAIASVLIGGVAQFIVVENGPISCGRCATARREVMPGISKLDKARCR